MDFGFQIADCRFIAYGRVKMSSPAGFYERLCEPRGAFLRNDKIGAQLWLKAQRSFSATLLKR